MARTFDDANPDFITLSLGALGFNGAKGVVAQVRKQDDGNSGCILYVGAATSGSARWSLSVNDANAIEYTEGTLTQASPSIRVTSAGGYCLIGVSKTEEGIPRFHKYAYATDTFTHENGTFAMADGDAPASFAHIGKTSAEGTYLHADVNALGVWAAPFDDSHFEAMAFDLRAFWDMDPVAVWVLDQLTVAVQMVTDLTGGGANESSKSSTTAVSSTPVPSFSYGHDLPTFTVRPGFAGGTNALKVDADSLLLSEDAFPNVATVSDTDRLELADAGNRPGNTVVTHLTDGASTVDGTIFNTASVDIDANELCLVAVLLTHTSPIGGPPTLSGGGMTAWTQIDFNIATNAEETVYGSLTIFRALQASPGAPAAITITAPATVSACAWSVDKISGVKTTGANGADAIVQIPTGGGGGSTSNQTAQCVFDDGFSDPDNLLWGAVGRLIQEPISPCTGFIETADRMNGDAAAPGTLETAWGATFEDVSWGWATPGASMFTGFEIAAVTGGLASGSPADYPLYFLEMNLNHPTSPNKTWVDLSSRLVSFKKNGPKRQFELENIEGGTIDLRMRNHDRALDPDFAAGPYYGSLFSDHEIRLKMLWLGRWRHVFYGFIESFDAERTGFSGQYTVVKANDATEVLASETIDSGPATLITAFGSNKDVQFFALAPGGTEVSNMTKKPLGGEDDPPTAETTLGEDLRVEYKAFTWIQGDEAFPRPLDDGITVRISASGTTTALAIRDAVNAYGHLVRAELAPGSNGSGKPPTMPPTNLAGGFSRALTGYRVNQVLSSLETPWPLGDRIIDAGLETIQAATVEKKNNVSALTHLVDVAVTTELGVLYVDSRGRVIFKQRNNRDFASSILTFTDQPVAPGNEEVSGSDNIALTDTATVPVSTRTDTDSVALSDSGTVTTGPAPPGDPTAFGSGRDRLPTMPHDLLRRRI